VIVANCFELADEEISQSVFQTLNSLRINTLHLASGSTDHPPDPIPDSSANRGRQIRCLISSFVI